MPDDIQVMFDRYKRFKQQNFDSIKQLVPDSTVPPGSLGPWTIDRIKLNLPEMVIARSLVKGERGWTPPGEYTRLIHAERGVIMSDTLDEREDLLPLVNAVQGRVLITGLGLGMAVDAALRKPSVSHVTVVEKNKRIIRLVGSHMKELHGDVVEIINADAFDWVPPHNAKWDWAWHDIWDEISRQILRDFGLLRARYRKHISSAQLCWAEKWARKYGA